MGCNACGPAGDGGVASAAPIPRVAGRLGTMDQGSGFDRLALPAGILALALAALAVHLGGAHPGPQATALRAPQGLPTARDLMPWEASAPVVAASLASCILLGLGVAARLSGRPVVAPGPLGRARTARRRELRSLHRPRRLLSLPWPGRDRRPPAPQVRLGSYRGRPIWLPADEHLLALGPTGAGKSSGLAIPALLEWPGPVVVTDPKGELVATTLSHRRSLGPTAVFAPLMRPSDRWNPLASIQSSEDALRVATFLMGRAPDREPFWHDLARQLLHGLLIEASQQGNPLAGVLSLLQSVPAERIGDSLAHPVAQRLASGALSGGDRTSMGVVATLVSQLGAYGSDEVAAATAASDFDPAGVASGELMSLYCVVTPHDAPVLRGLVSALISCSWRALFANPPAPPALFVLDEFAQLTTLPELPALVQLGRSQGVRMMLLAQDLGSITSAYGPEAAGALWSNSRTKLLLPGISELELLERASRLAGTATLHRQAHPHGWEAVAAQPLLHADDIRRLRPDRALLIHGADHTAVIRQTRWFESARMRQHVPQGKAAPARLRPAPGRPLRDWTRPDPGWAAAASPLPWDVGDEEA